MKYNYQMVDTHVVTLQAIVQGMENNLSNITTLRDQLLADFSGVGANGYQEVMAQLNNKMNQYNATLASVKGAIAQAAGTQGLMHVTDQNNGNRFLAPSVGSLRVV
ncbi:WXG100 family type VII secretion target [Nocardia sp. NPDC006044]|uniref:WXG100 family type VII secretion target n=1 Tax=Nocardia sp. NPDC006044 TaxID=3364306 RepID=UPI0036B3312A